MINSENTGNRFYQELGKLFYAIAFADRKVHPKEVQALLKDIRDYWVKLDDQKDDFGTDAAYQIEIVFDWLESTTTQSEELFNEFEEYYKEYPSRFTPKVKSLVLHTANDIAGSFAGKNKAELIMLTKLANLFNQSPATA